MSVGATVLAVGALLSVTALVGRLVVLPCWRAYRWVHRRLQMLDEMHDVLGGARDAASRADKAAREVLSLAFKLSVDTDALKATLAAHTTAVEQLRAHAVAHDRLHAESTR